MLVEQVDVLVEQVDVLVEQVLSVFQIYDVAHKGYTL